MFSCSNNLQQNIFPLDFCSFVDKNNVPSDFIVDASISINFLPLLFHWSLQVEMIIDRWRNSSLDSLSMNNDLSMRSSWKISPNKSKQQKNIVQMILEFEREISFVIFWFLGRKFVEDENGIENSVSMRKKTIWILTLIRKDFRWKKSFRYLWENQWED